MVAVLVTGMSGSGKSTALAGLAERGYETVDTDEPGWIELVDGEPLWREGRVLALLDRPRTVPCSSRARSRTRAASASASTPWSC